MFLVYRTWENASDPDKRNARHSVHCARWNVEDAERIAEQLRADGFSAWVEEEEVG